jgi:hypothetical protein
MSSVVISGDTSGAITLAAPAVSGTNTATLPAATGTVMVSGNQPAFNVALSSNQSISATTWTKVAFNSEYFDTANAFDSTTNYRFQPLVAGYYQLYASAAYNGTFTGSYISLYKNGASFQRRQISADSMTTISSLVYFNGSTDYVEVYVYVYGSPTSVNGDIKETYFTGCLSRTA